MPVEISNNYNFRKIEEYTSYKITSRVANIIAQTVNRNRYPDSTLRFHGVFNRKHMNEDMVNAAKKVSNSNTRSGSLDLHLSKKTKMSL